MTIALLVIYFLSVMFNMYMRNQAAESPGEAYDILDFAMVFAPVFNTAIAIGIVAVTIFDRK